MRIELTDQRQQRRKASVAAILFAGILALVPRQAFAEGLFDLFFGGFHKQQHQTAPAHANFFADLFQQNQQPAPPLPVASSGPAFCVRSCDGKYFPLTRGNASPVQMCQAFCPASPTKVFYGGNIDSATSATGERYADSENAFAYRKALRADCTCNGRDAAGLAPVDLTMDSSLRAGDVIATTDGLVAYSGIKVGNNSSPEFIPVASYPGLTADVRARLGAMKVAPVAADALGGDAPRADSDNDGIAPAAPAARSVPSRDKRAELN
ncbi:DUF2865 domain-containing protein [Bradyrhizobium sp.]|uniref:DUF2865 domain-containing protein n=1 Tax=Bradyrhizobium sp. TaxID=376 RepID=UPI002622CA59|nr:DUF2865 domain-containing protein [Bradyrhizobium sp.]